MRDSLTHLDLSVQATQDLPWPHYAGSTLRGAFGRTLRRKACITQAPSCEGCPLRTHCAYGATFDPAPAREPLHPSFKNGLPQYLIQAPPLGARRLRAGDLLRIRLSLLPGALTHRALIESLLPEWAARDLISPGLFQLTDIDPHTSELPLPTPSLKPASTDSTSRATAHVELHWHTPLRLQTQGKPLFKPEQLDSAKLVQALNRRLLQWAQIIHHRHAPDTTLYTLAAHSCQLDTQGLQWHDLKRHSSRHERQVPLGGLIGRARWSGPSEAIALLTPLIELGAQLHVGKETIMGLGRYSHRLAAA